MMLIKKYQYSDTDPGRSARVEPSAFSVPARGDAYDFAATVYCTRIPAGRRWGALWSGDEEEIERLHEIVREIARATAREYSIFDAGAAEQAVNDRLRMRLDDEARTGAGQWTVRVELTPPEEVRELMREALRKRHEIETNAEADALRREKTDELREGWRRFLDQTAADPIARYAVRLAEAPEGVAEVLKAVHDERRKGAEDLLKVIDRIAEAYQSADIVGLVVNSETVLRETLKLVGIEPPSLDPDAVLVPIDGDL